MTSWDFDRAGSCPVGTFPGLVQRRAAHRRIRSARAVAIKFVLMRSASQRAYLPDVVLVGVVLVWGSSFVVIKEVLQTAAPLGFLFFRFLLAGVLMLPILLRRARGRELWRDGLLLGALLALGMGSQVVGQVETSASKAAFITGLCVPLTPLVGTVRTRRPPSLENLIGIVLATVGFFLLTFPSGRESLSRGDLLVSVCALTFAVYIVEMSVRALNHDAAALTGIQLWVVALMAGASWLLIRSLSSDGSVFASERPIEWNGSFLFGVFYLGSIGAVGTFFGQTWAQKFMSATHAAILFALEPVFAAFLAAWILGERFGLRAGMGAALILCGVIVSELRLRKLHHRQENAQVAEKNQDGR